MERWRLLAAAAALFLLVPVYILLLVPAPRPPAVGGGAGREPRHVCFVAVPKAMVKANGLRQSTAMRSWLRAFPTASVYAYGNETGIDELLVDLAAEFPRHGRIESRKTAAARNAYGTPLLSSVFADLFDYVVTAEGGDVDRLLFVYINADIILLHDFARAVAAAELHFDDFFMVGQRYDTVVDGLDLRLPEAELAFQIDSRDGEWRGGHYKDYFAFTLPAFGTHAVPPFAIGRGVWDDYLTVRGIESGMPVVDATAVARVVHANHDYKHIGGSAGDPTIERPWRGTEEEENKAHMTPRFIWGNVQDATFRLVPCAPTGQPSGQQVSAATAICPVINRASAAAQLTFVHLWPHLSLHGIVLLATAGYALFTIARGVLAARAKAAGLPRYSSHKLID